MYFLEHKQNEISGFENMLHNILCRKTDKQWQATGDLINIFLLQKPISLLNLYNKNKDR